MTDQESSLNHADMERGSNAAIAESVVRPIIIEKINQTVHHMVNDYRTGDVDYEDLLGKVAEISALQMLLSQLETDQRRGIIAREKELSNAAPEADPSVDDEWEY